MSHDALPPAPRPVLQLPTLIISPTDVAHLSRELEALGDFLQQSRIRNSSSPPSLPRTSSLFEELGVINKLDWLSSDDRERGAAFLDFLKVEAPVVHISFAADPSAAFMAKLVLWLRRNLHPLLLVRIGLQPTIAAGFILRTNNHVYDFSLRRHLTDSRRILVETLQKSVMANER